MCLYGATATSGPGGHSTKVGEASDAALTPIYGRYEDTDRLPLLDACGGHYGYTPDSPTAQVYHHHAQADPPYMIGCYGPNDDGSLVTVEQCRAFYAGCDGVLSTYETTRGTEKYDLWCPCFDANVSNTGVNIQPLAVFADASAAKAWTAPVSSGAPTAAPTSGALGLAATAAVVLAWMRADL